VFTTNAMIPRIRNAHGNPIVRIIACVESEYTSPPKPDPAAEIPFASERRVLNHCAEIPTLPTNRKPMPQPKHKPWLRKRCHILVAKEAPMKEAVSSTTPINKVVLVEKTRVVSVAMGETIKAIEMERPPMKA
jgi:hypothetical protein